MAPPPPRTHTRGLCPRAAPPPPPPLPHSLIGMAGSTGSMALMWVKAQLDGDWRALFMVLSSICGCTVLAAAYLFHTDQQRAAAVVPRGRQNKE